MKYIFPLLLFSLTQVSCKKETAYSNEGVITGIDLRLCPCVVDCPCACGSLIFHFTDTGDTTRTILDNPTIFQLPDNVQYPVHVKINWQSTSRCNISSIKITGYKIL
jgi:hypothetical protein